MLSNQIYNQLYSIYRIKKNFSINTQYEFTNSLFDRVLGSIEWLNILDKQSLDQCGVPSNLSIISNPLEFSNKKIIFEDTIKKYILLFHQSKMYNFIKKEDISIVNSNLKKYKKICFSENITRWNISDMTYVKYGIPNIYERSSEQRKSILVLNLNNSSQTNTVYHILKQTFSDIDILNKKELSLEEIYETISKYKICIDFDSYFNLLIAGACGCYGIGTGQQIDKNIFSVKESNEIPIIVKKILENYNNEQSLAIKDNTIETYSFEKFNNALKDIMITISLESI